MDLILLDLVVPKPDGFQILRTLREEGVQTPVIVLTALARRAGEVVSRYELLREVWGYGSDVMSRTVDTHVRQLRMKLEDPRTEPWILTVRKSGYPLRSARTP